MTAPARLNRSWSFFLIFTKCVLTAQAQSNRSSVELADLLLCDGSPDAGKMLKKKKAEERFKRAGAVEMDVDMRP